MSNPELEIAIAADLMKDIRDGSAEAAILVDLIRAAGFSHETVSVTFVLTSDDDA